MYRLIAYQILVEVMEDVIASSAPLHEEFKKIVNIAKKSLTYTIELKVIDNHLAGSIHNNNTQKFELLEEVIKLGHAVKPRDDS